MIKCSVFVGVLAHYHFQDSQSPLTSFRPLQNLSKTLFMLPPFSMEMTLV